MKRSILVVEDDSTVRRMLVASLGELGHKVLTAADGYEAIRVLVRDWVDVMVTDIKMPGLNGFELAQQAKLLRPKLRIIYMSGYYSEIEQGVGPTYGRLLEKPVRPAALHREIERALFAGVSPGTATPSAASPSPVLSGDKHRPRLS